MSVLPVNESVALLLLGNSRDLISGTAVTTRTTQMQAVMIDRIGVNFSLCPSHQDKEQWFSNFLSPPSPSNTMHTQGPLDPPHVRVTAMQFAQIPVRNFQSKCFLYDYYSR
jgi:hypothetical protein